MAATRLQQYQLLTNSTFAEQVAGSLLAAAFSVVNEAASTTDHANRLAYANSILVSGNPLGQATLMLPMMLTNATIAGEAGNANGASGTPVADSDVDFVVASLFTQFADAYANR